ncbi:MAG: hypothetical protein K2F85_06825, partial [Helicobacter sp.]|nr:hypothetical protein [Helicobacter sp.]
MVSYYYWQDDRRAGDFVVRWLPAMTFHCVIASASVAINEQRIPNKKRAQSYGEATAQRRFGFCLTSQEEERAGVGGQRGI